MTEQDDASTAPTAGPPRLLRTVVLVGMMGSGKTAIGRALAQRLDAPFLDSDAEIETAANATIAEIFSRDGEAFFRDREAEVISRLLDGPPCVLSTGGGAFLAERNRDAITQNGVSLWLDVSLETLWDRVSHKDTRPLLRTDNPFETLRSIFEERYETYKLANLSVKARGSYSIDETTNHVVAALGMRPDILEMQA